MQSLFNIFRPDALVALLAVLRLAAALVMLGVLAVVQQQFALSNWLWLLPLGLLAFNGVLWRRGQWRDASSTEIATHLSFDTVALFLMFWLSGGATNPFVSLFLLPVALSAVSLALTQAVAVSGLCIAAYTVLLLRYLDHTTHPGQVVGFEHHVIGMWLNFVLAAILLCAFLFLLATLLRRREQELAAERERLMRDDAIVSVAMVAAGAAHAINTPLCTITVAAESIAEDPALPAHFQEDIDTIREQARLCGQQLQRLAAAQHNTAQAPRSLPEFAGQTIERWRIRRPEIEIAREGMDSLPAALVRHDPALDQALLNLFDNAADAAAAVDDPCVRVIWRCDAEPRGMLELIIDDPGVLDNPAVARRELAASSKPTGLGLGLTLARASIARLGGRLRLEPRVAGGTRTSVQLPLAALHDTPGPWDGANWSTRRCKRKY